MKRSIRSIALLAVTLLCAAGLRIAGSTALAAPDPELVSTAQELLAALEAAQKDPGTAVTICYADRTTAITLGGTDAVTIPANVALDLGVSGGMLTIAGGTVYVSGAITGGSVSVTGGTLVRGAGSSITAHITLSGGAVRGARVLELENPEPGDGETIVSIVYAGAAEADTSAFVTRAAGATVYPLLSSGSNYTTVRVIERVTTSAGVYRLGTRLEKLSREYAISYEGLSGAALAGTNPVSYTASDAAITLVNPAREGFVFDGWTCAVLSLTTPTQSAAIPEGNAGALTFTANWTRAQGQGGFGGGARGQGAANAASDTDADESGDAAQGDPAAPASGDAQANVRIGRGKSSTKVAFTSGVDAVIPTPASVSKPAPVWGWIALIPGAAAAIAYTAARLLRRGRKNTDR